MKTTKEILQEIITESYLPDDLQKKSKPFTVGKVSGHRVSVNSNTVSGVKDQIHSHLTSKGFKRNAVLSDTKSSTYEHPKEGQVHVTHTGNTITIERDSK